MFNFKSINELLIHFQDERLCWDYLEQQLWNGKPVCPHCDCTTVYRLKNYKQFKCGNKKTCDKKFNVLCGTMYENTKLHLSKWFAAIYMCTSYKKGLSSHQLARTLGITQRSAWFILHRVNKMIEATTNSIELSKTVLTDETYLKGELKNKSRKKRIAIWKGEAKDESATIIGMVELDGNTVLKHVKNAHHKNVYPVMQATIKDKETILVTHLYKTIGQEYSAHMVLNHSAGEYVKNGYHTNTIEGVFSWFKRTIYGTHHWVSFKHLQRYCNIFSYRYNTRKFNDQLRFDTTMKQGSKSRLTYNDLIGKEKPINA